MLTLRATLCTVLLVATTSNAGHSATRDRPRRTTPKLKPVPGERAFNECSRIPRGRRVKITLRPDSGLRDLVGWISSMTCKRFIVADALGSRRVTLIAPTAMRPREAYRAFISALQVMGLTVVPRGRLLKIVRSADAMRAAVPVYGDKQRRRLPNDETVVTQIVRLRRADATKIAGVLGTLRSPTSAIATFAPTNTLIITDAAANVRRLLRITNELDVEIAGARTRVVRLKHADASDVTRLVNEVLSHAPPTKPVPSPTKPRAFADVRTNALILVADDAAIERARRLIARLDVAHDDRRPTAWVYRLKHSQAADVAQTLTKIGGAKRGKKAAGRSMFGGDMTISADKPNNALVIVATARDYIELRRVLRELDKPRRQVFVEAYILEVGGTTSRDLGVAYHGATKAGGSTLLAGLGHGADLSSVVMNPLSLMGLAAGVQGASVPGTEGALGGTAGIPSFGIVLQALQADGNVNVLSSPALLTSDNQEAEIVVGKKIPVRTSAAPPNLPSGTDVSTLAALSFTQQVQRVDVGISLKVTPTIGDGDSVRLRLRQEVSSVLSTDLGGLGPTTAQRRVQSVVTVRDQQTVVIGGLITDRVTESISKIPFLGDIPILGHLFRRTRKTKEKVNLLVVLTPYIIRDRSDLRRIYKRKLDERREYLRRTGQDGTADPAVDIDYRYKRGVLGEIHLTAVRLERDARLATKANAEKTRP